MAEPGVRWPREKWISPSALRHYATCPRRVRLQYIDRLTGELGFRLFFSKGIIAHSILQHGARRLQLGHELPATEAIEQMARQRLPRQPIPSEAWESHVRDIVRWVAFGFSYLDLRAHIVRIERPDDRPFIGPRGVGRFTLCTRPDLILLRFGEAGVYAEFIDYKTGKRRDDPATPVLARFVFRELLKEHFTDATQARVIFTYLWLASREVQQYELTLDFCEAQFQTITASIQSLFDETAWEPRPSGGCNYCPYHGNACTAGMNWNVDAVTKGRGPSCEGRESD